MTRARILVVEDEILVARDIKQQLEDAGYEVVACTSRGEDALILTEQLRPELVLMDIQLAGAMDGVSAAQAMRETWGVAVVFLSAYAAEEVLARAKMVEPYGYILKPFSDRELHMVVEMALFKHQADVRLQELALHNQTILDNMADGVVTIDDHGRMESCNVAACRMFGYSLAELLGRNVSMLMPAPHQGQHDHYLQHYRETGVARMVGLPRDLQGLRRDGSLFTVNLSVSSVMLKQKAMFIGLVRDVSEQQNDREEIRRLAYYDALTGLPNRRLLMDRLTHAMQTASRTGQYCAFMLLDLDHFKQLNDTLGHDVGDQLLQRVASRLRECVQEGDSVARIGGDEFVVLLENLSEQPLEAATQAEMVAIKLLEVLALPYQLQDHVYTTTPSIGIVQFVGNQQAAEELLKQVDLAMYQAKAAGRNTACFFDPEVQAAAAAHLALERDIRKGIDEQSFLLHYQIQVNAQGQTTGAEALVRWNHPTRGMVSPAQFIQIAEETGLILPLGQWVLETACAQLVRWADDAATAQWTIAVNVSASQFAQPDFVANVEKAVAITGANPHLLKLELTESMLLVDVDTIVIKMNAIMQRGVAFSLDDFGTGYSSLSYLKRLPLTQLKIDQSFVRDVLLDPSDAAIARTILALGHSLGLKVIAEGVETAEQHHFLASMGCDAFQGYFFGRPQPAEKLALAHGATDVVNGAKGAR